MSGDRGRLRVSRRVAEPPSYAGAVSATTPTLRWWTPRLLPGHLLMILAVAVAGALGVWQWDAWQTRRADAAADLTAAAPIPLAEAFGPDDPFPGDRVGQPVTTAGTWLPDTLYVTGREHEGRDGVWVVSPLAIGSGADAPAILVVRGWAAGLDAAAAAGSPTGAAEITGWLQPPEGATDVQDDDTSDDVLPQLRIADALQYVDRDLYGGYVVVDQTAPNATNSATAGLTAAELEQRPESGRFTAVRNLLYAIEWWVFGAFALFMWWRWLRDTLADPVERADPAETF